MIKKTLLYIIASAASLSNPALAEDGGKWYGKLYGGASSLGDQSIKQTGVAANGATGKIKNDSGFMLGGSVGYHYTNNFSVEVAWDYTSNDSKTNFSDGTNFNEGDFASNIFFLNGRYTFEPMATTKIRPYLGAGLGYVQEIDIDLESGGVERSYSQDGEFAYQLMAGITYPITEAIDFDAGLRYVRADSIKFERESGDGELRKVDYDPILFTIGLSYKF